MPTRLPRKTYYTNPTTGVKISSEKHPITDPQDLANQGFVPTGTKEKVEGGTLYAGSVDPNTGTRFERFVRDPKITGITNNDITGGIQEGTQEKKDITGDKTGNEIQDITDIIKEPDREKIRTQKIQDAQSLINVIKEQFNRRIAEEREIGEDLEGRRRSLNVAGGLSGSDIATAKAADVEERNRKVIQSYEAERDSRIQAIMNDVRSDTDETFEKRRKEFIEQKEDKEEAEKEFIKEAKEEAFDRIDRMIESGIDSEEFKKGNKDVYDKLLRNTGLTEIELDSMWNAKTKTPVKYQYKELKDGTLLRTGDDGSIKEMGNYAPPDEDIAWKLEPQLDGTLYWVKKNDEDEIIDFKKFQSDKKVGGTKKITAKQEYEEDLRTLTELASQVIGDDTFLSPDDYLAAKKEWISKGYSPSNFDKEFEGFRNPENPNYKIGGIKKEQEFAKKEKEEKKEEEKKSSNIQKLEDAKNQGFSKRDIENSVKSKNDGIIPDYIQDWLKENY